MTWRDGWVCQGCTFANDHPAEPVCEICQQSAPGASSPNQGSNSKGFSCSASQSYLSRASRISPPRSKPDSVEIISLDSDKSDDCRQCSATTTTATIPVQRGNWTCQYCTAVNAPNLLDCRVCFGTRSTSADAALKAANLGAPSAVASRFINEPRRDDIEVIDLDASDDEVVESPSDQAHTVCHDLGDIRLQEHSTKVTDSQRKPVKSTSDLSQRDAKKKTALNKSRMLGTYYWSEVIVHIPEPVWKKYSPFIRESVEVLRGDINAFSVSDRTNWITWDRKRFYDLLEPDCFDKTNNRLILDENCPVSIVPVPFSAIFYEAADFIGEYESGQVLARIRAALQTPDSRVALLVFDLRRAVRLRANKAMRKQLAQPSTDGNNNTGGLSSVGQIDEFAAFLINEFNCRCSFLNFASLNEVGMFLTQTTRHIAQLPYKPDAVSSLGFRHQNVVKSAVVGGIFTPAMKEWFNVLIRIPGISPKRAEGVIKRYPSCASLIFAYSNCRSNEERKLLLTNIEVDGKKLSHSVSSTVFDYLYST